MNKHAESILQKLGGEGFMSTNPEDYNEGEGEMISYWVQNDPTLYAQWQVESKEWDKNHPGEVNDTLTSFIHTYRDDILGYIKEVGKHKAIKTAGGKEVYVAGDRGSGLYKVTLDKSLPKAGALVSDAEGMGEKYKCYIATITEAIEDDYNLPVGRRVYVLSSPSDTISSVNTDKGVVNLWGEIDPFARDDIKAHPEWGYELLDQ